MSLYEKERLMRESILTNDDWYIGLPETQGNNQTLEDKIVLYNTYSTFSPRMESCKRG